jgi:hypothetical protein
MAIKNNVELRATLSMVLIRASGEPKSVEEWQAIENALYDALWYAKRTKVMREEFKKRYPDAKEGA